MLHLRRCSPLLPVLGLALLACAGCERKPPPKPPEPPAVTVATPVRKSVEVYGEYVGLTDSPQTVEIRARVAGFLKEIRFQEGAEVEQGALLFVIDPDQYQVALAKAQALLLTAQAALLQARNVKDVEVAKATLAKADAELVNATQYLKDTKAAVAGEAAPRGQLDAAVAREKEARASVEAGHAQLAQAEADYQTRVAQAEASVAAAKAAVADAQLNLNYTTIYSPVKGRVGLAQRKIGSLVGQNEATLLATVSLVDPVYVTFTVSERELYELRKVDGNHLLSGLVGKETPIRMVLEDGQFYPLPGKINFADRALDSGTGTLALRGEFPNPDKFLRPGNYAKVRMQTSRLPDALLVKEVALGADQGGAFVLVVNGQNVVERRSVKTGPREAGMIVIREGLKDDEHVVVKGLQRARPGSTVKPVQEK